MASKRKGVMLAKKMTPALLDKMPEKVFFQPKLNGMRCRAKKIDGKVWLFSSQGNVINSVPHINKALEEAFKDDWNTQLDGELYKHGMPVQDIESIARKTTRLDKDYKELSYYLFDIITNLPQENRSTMLAILTRINTIHPELVVLRTAENNKSNWEHYFDLFVADGYEGLIIRDPNAFYKEGKASCLLKEKKLLKKEFAIEAAFEADAVKGVQVNLLGGLILRTENGDHFRCGAGCLPHKERERLWANTRIWCELVGHKAVIEYPELTKRGVPFQPILKEII